MQAFHMTNFIYCDSKINCDWWQLCWSQHIPIEVLYRTNFYEMPSYINAIPTNGVANKQDKTTCNIRASASWNLSGERSTSLGNIGST